MSAAEHGYREPPDPYPSWLSICDNVFNDFVSRWDLAHNTCGGGLKWQIFPSSAGYTYKKFDIQRGLFPAGCSISSLYQQPNLL
jgi:mannan endo-1,6-alpha-mannosidase